MPSERQIQPEPGRHPRRAIPRQLADRGAHNNFITEPACIPLGATHPDHAASQILADAVEGRAPVNMTAIDASVQLGHAVSHRPAATDVVANQPAVIGTTLEPAPHPARASANIDHPATTL